MPFRLLLALLATAPMTRSADVSHAIPRVSRQLVVVATESWTASPATVQRYSRASASGPWLRVGAAMPALVGERGLAWGLGLHPVPRGEERIKREGDRCAPAGVFRITGAFGVGDIGALRLPFQRLTPGLEAVDDPASRAYNRLVDRAALAQPDWRSSERLAASPHYALGLTIAHNPRAVPGAGSCIFLHLWLGRRTGTAGCTVLRRPALLALTRWLDAAQSPILVQAPRDEVAKLALPK